MSVTQQLLELKSTLPPHVTLVAVSKTKPLALLQEAYAAGQRDFGENYVQELTEKQPLMPADTRWHFIGHLQSNKVKYIAPFVHLIHGIDSLKLLQEVNKQALKNNRIIDVLLQLHIAQEETKFGFDFEECRHLLCSDALNNLTGVRVRGFMAMASNTEDQAIVRKEFASVKAFSNEMCQRRDGLDILSYGMSGDYALAIQEGSTMVRVGSLIFGEREYAAK